MNSLDRYPPGALFRVEHQGGAAVRDEGEHMQRGATETTPMTRVADIQFAGKRGRRTADWRSRPAAELERVRADHAVGIEQRLERGLLLDGIR